MVLKPSGDKTEDIIEEFAKLLKMRVIVQEKGYVIDALNLGLENASGDIIVFLDDNAIPFPDWLQNLVETYGLQNVGGVAGAAIPAFLNERNMALVDGQCSGIIPESKRARSKKLLVNLVSGNSSHIRQSVAFISPSLTDLRRLRMS